MMDARLFPSPRRGIGASCLVSTTIISTPLSLVILEPFRQTTITRRLPSEIGKCLSPCEITSLRRTSQLSIPRSFRCTTYATPQPRSLDKVLGRTTTFRRNTAVVTTRSALVTFHTSTICFTIANTMTAILRSSKDTATPIPLLVESIPYIVRMW